MQQNKGGAYPPVTQADILARILYRDDEILVLDKPPGIAVHPGKGEGPNLLPFFEALKFEQAQPPALAHRLDRETSGCLVLGRTKIALKKLGGLFSRQQAHKTYWAVVEGIPAEPQDRINLALAPENPGRSWRMCVAMPGQQGAQEAVTDYEVLGRDTASNRAFLALTPHTGRTHQLRLHCAASGFPIVGDRIYGDAYGPDAPLLHLHARGIELPYYGKRAPLAIEAPPPPHMLAALAACGWAAS